jgi:hypothetical protein
MKVALDLPDDAVTVVASPPKLFTRHNCQEQLGMTEGEFAAALAPARASGVAVLTIMGYPTRGPSPTHPCGVHAGRWFAEPDEHWPSVSLILSLARGERRRGPGGVVKGRVAA